MTLSYLICFDILRGGLDIILKLFQQFLAQIKKGSWYCLHSLVQLFSLCLHLCVQIKVLSALNFENPIFSRLWLVTQEALTLIYIDGLLKRLIYFYLRTNSFKLIKSNYCGHKACHLLCQHSRVLAISKERYFLFFMRSSALIVLVNSKII